MYTQALTTFANQMSDIIINAKLPSNYNILLANSSLSPSSYVEFEKDLSVLLYLGLALSFGIYITLNCVFRFIPINFIP